MSPIPAADPVQVENRRMNAVESSIVELMDSVLTLESKESEAFGIVFKYVPMECLKCCRLVSKTLHEPATKHLMLKTQIRLHAVASLQRYVQQVSNMKTIWSNYSVIVNNKLTAEMLLQFGVVCGAYVKKLELDIRYREVRLNYLEDLLSEELLPNLEELTLKGKFPATAMFLNPQRMMGKLGKLQVFNLLAKGWHRLPPLTSGEVPFKNPTIGHLLSAMPNLILLNYFPDVDSPRDAHGHYRSFLFNLTENQNVMLSRLTEIQNFTLSFSDVTGLERFASKGFPLTKFHVLVEEEIQPEAFCQFLETFRNTLTHLVIRSATENPIKWPRLLKLEELILIGLNIHGTDFLASFPSLKSLTISQDRVTGVDIGVDRTLHIPHTITCLKIIEVVAVNAARLSDTSLQIIFRSFPYLIELVICQNINSSQPTFSDEGMTGAKTSISEAELSVRPRDLRVVNRNLMRFSHFIGSLSELQKLTLRASNISDVSLLCGIVNCPRLVYLDISSSKISERACIELLDYLNISRLRIQDFGSFTSSGRAEILGRRKFKDVFYASQQTNLNANNF